MKSHTSSLTPRIPATCPIAAARLAAKVNAAARERAAVAFWRAAQSRHTKEINRC